LAVRAADITKGIAMQIYMFTSEASPNLNAFAGDASGTKLPENHAPWNAAGSLRSDQSPPHRFSRAKIEEAIKLIGFQLWRMKPPQDEKQPQPRARQRSAAAV
jgi:hypothetical protein